MKSKIATLLMMGLLTGCGTIANQVNPQRTLSPYGGVRYDVDTACDDGGPSYLLLLDLPFSAVADTLLLPFELQ